MGIIMAKNKTTITIAGKDYSIVSDDPSEYIHRVAFTLNEKITKLAGESVSLNSNMLLTLVALNLTDDYLKASDALYVAREQNDTLVKQVHTLEIERTIAEAAGKKSAQKSASSENELAELRAQIEALRAENEALKADSAAVPKVMNFHK